ncbi:MAG: DnaJ domain-containing protein, partial [Paracoccus sp. (in: a-proteobacteria)]
RREREIEERERRLREAEQRQAYQQQEHGHRARTGWQQEAKGFRQKAGQQKSGARQQDAAGWQTHSYSPPPQNDLRDKHLKTLGLKPGRNYSPDEIKRAYHRKAMKVHPDAGGSQAELIEVVNAYEWLRC